MTDLLALENAISSSSSHASNIEQLRAIYHVIICEEDMSIGARVRKGLSSNMPYLLASRHKHPWPQPGSTNFPRLPRELLSPEASYQGALSDPSGQIGVQADCHTRAPERFR